jgi:intracellular sulfur oxidation DsrE/DsrF family protein
LAVLFSVGLFLVMAGTANADDAKPFAKHHVVIQVSKDDPATWNLAMNNANNLIKEFGTDNIDVVIVAYGPGLKMMLANSKTAKRVTDVSMQGVEFDACHNTMEHMAKKIGHLPKLTEGVKVVPSGAGQIVLLEQKGYAYLRP